MTSCHAVDRELAGDQRRAAAVAVLDDLHQIAPLAGGEPVGPPVVEDQQIDLDQRAEQPREAAVAVGELQIGEQPRHAGVVHGVAVAAGLLRERAGLSHDLPTPHGPVTSKLRCSAIQRPVASCWNSALSSRRGVR